VDEIVVAFQADDGIRIFHVTGVQACALPISPRVLRVGWCTVLREEDGEVHRVVGSPSAPETRAGNAPFLPLDRPTVLDETASWANRRASFRERVEVSGAAVSVRCVAL